MFDCDFNFRMPNGLPKEWKMLEWGGTAWHVDRFEIKDGWEYAAPMVEITAHEIGEPASPFEIDRVIFNDPATIVFWKDGTKTVVKCQDGDVFEERTGLLYAIAKKAYGNKGSYYNVLREHSSDSSGVARFDFRGLIKLARCFAEDVAEAQQGMTKADHPTEGADDEQ